MLGFVKIAAAIGVMTVKVISTALKIGTASSSYSMEYADPYDDYIDRIAYSGRNNCNDYSNRQHVGEFQEVPTPAPTPTTTNAPSNSRRWDSQFGYYQSDRQPMPNYSEPNPVTNMNGCQYNGTMNQIANPNYYNNNQMNYNNDIGNGCRDMSSRRFSGLNMNNNNMSRRFNVPPPQPAYNVQPPPMQQYNLQPPPMQQHGIYQQPTQCVDWRMTDQQNRIRNSQCVGSSKPWNERQPIFNWDYIRNYGWDLPKVQQDPDGVVAMFYDPQGNPLFGPAVL